MSRKTVGEVGARMKTPFGTIIRNARRSLEKKTNGVQMADKVGISPETLSKIETNSCETTTKTLDRLAAVMGKQWVLVDDFTVNNEKK